MLSARPVEHFVTLFDNLYLPAGMALHSSLMKHAQPFKLWIICMDEAVESKLAELALEHVLLIPISEAENEDLLAAKTNRSRGEYCWTVTPYASEFVFERAPDVERVTYVDADIFLFDSPLALFREFEDSNKHVMITEHAYDPKLDETENSGRFCVQFITVRRTSEAHKVVSWWQSRCLEWCYDRVEGGKFGDQKYLDDWPSRFAYEVHVLLQTEKTLAPWNVRMFAKKSGGHIDPIIYHFQSLQLISTNCVRLHMDYPIGKAAGPLYSEYLDCLAHACRRISGELGQAIPYASEAYRGRNLLRHWKGRMLRRTRYAKLPDTENYD